MTLHKFSTSFHTQSPAIYEELAVRPQKDKGGAGVIEYRLIMQLHLHRTDTYADFLRSARFKDPKHHVIQV